VTRRRRSGGLRLAIVALVLVRAGSAAGADPAPVEERRVREAIEAAGPNRAEIEAFLARFEKGEDREKREASRFLVANMPEKGHVLFELRDAKGAVIPFDALSFATFAEAQEALDRIEKERGAVDFVRARTVPDLETVRADALSRHLDRAFAVWRASPAPRRVGFATFLEYVLPYRGSEEPLDDWLTPLSLRHEEAATTADPSTLYERIARDAGERVRFDERYYLHPTDQGFSAMERSRMGRCEDITNFTTYGARSVGLATAADFTPAWGHRDNNHAWNVLLDAAGRGSDPVGRRAAKVYRKTFSIRRESLAFRLPPGREAPNRWVGSKSFVDVTDQYGPTTDVTVALDADAVGAETLAYHCVFNGGEWVAIQWAPVEVGRATFPRMGRDLLYLPAVHDGKALRPAAPPRVVRPDGRVESLDATGAPVPLVARATSPAQRSPDTHEVTPTSSLRSGATYSLHVWRKGRWDLVAESVAGPDPMRLESVPGNALLWLVEKDSRRLERPFTIEDGGQRFW
jgi:hypothetical protein